MNEIKHVYIIVEGLSDETILNCLLKDSFPETIKIHFYVAQGFSSIISSARPIIDLTDDDVKIVLAFDADTTNPSRVQERMDFVKSAIGANKEVQQRLHYTCFVPAIDGIVKEGFDIARMKRINRTEYNHRIEEAIIMHKTEILSKSPIKEMVEFINSD